VQKIREEGMRKGNIMETTYRKLRGNAEVKAVWLGCSHGGGGRKTK
jgi:hypothetical protein